MNMRPFNFHCCNNRNPIRKWFIEKRLRKLKLDENQKMKLDDIFARASMTSEDHFNTKHEVQKHITAMMAGDGFNREKTAELIHAAVGQHEHRMIEIIETFGEFYEALQPDQQAKIQTMWQKRGMCGSRYCH